MITRVADSEIGRLSLDVGYRTTYNVALKNDLFEFLDSGEKACEVSNPGYKTPTIFCTMVRRYIDNMNLDITAKRRGDKVFLVRGGSR